MPATGKQHCSMTMTTMALLLLLLLLCVLLLLLLLLRLLFWLLLCLLFCLLLSLPLQKTQRHQVKKGLVVVAVAARPQ